MVLLILFLKQRRSKLLGIISIAVVLLGVGGIVSSVWVVQRITEKRVEKYEENTGRKVEAKVSDGGRVAFQQMGFEIFLDSPVVGGGARAFSYRALEKWDPDTLELWMGDPEFAHNEFIQLLSDYGLVGFVLVLALLFIHGILGVINLVSEDDRDSGLSIWQLGAAGGLVAMLCQSYFSFIFHFPACVVLCAFQLAILASQSKEKPKNRPVFRFTELVIGIGGLGVAAALAFLGINFFKGYLLSKEAVQKLTAQNQWKMFLRDSKHWRKLVTGRGTQSLLRLLPGVRCWRPIPRCKATILLLLKNLTFGRKRLLSVHLN